MFRVFDPNPKIEPLEIPKRRPKRIVPSYIGESGQVLNLLMYRGAGDAVRDYSGQGNHGTIHGAKWTDEGIASWALSFDGLDDYVNCGEVYDPATGPLTVLFWIRTTTSGYWECPIAKAPDFPFDGWSGWRFNLGADGTDSNFDLVEDTSNSRINGGAINDGEWHHVVLWWDGSTQKIYVDGAVQASASWSGDVSNAYSVYIGATSNGEKYFNGAEGLVRMYSRALSDSEVKAHCEATKPLYA